MRNYFHSQKIDEIRNSYYLKIRSFASSYLSSRGYDYQSFLRSSFSSLKKEKGENLVIDLRGNGGGDDGNGSALMSYLMDKPFNYYGSIEVTPAYDGWGAIAEKNGKRLLQNHNDLGIHQPSELNFNGDVFILIDGGSFSATSEFAALIHHQGRAVFIGEETGGGYYGNTSGNRLRIDLVNTQISTSIPRWKYLVAIEGDKYYGHGVPAHTVVIPTVSHIKEGKDAALEKAISLIGTK